MCNATLSKAKKKGMPVIKLVLSDVDGTLIPLGTKLVSPRVIDAIDAVERAGVRFGLSTGRDEVELNKLFGGNNIGYRTGILSNGKKLKVDGNIVRLTLIEHEGHDAVAQMVKEYEGCFATAYPLNTDPSNPVYCITPREEDVRMWSQRYSFVGKRVDHVPNEDILGATIAVSQGPEVMSEIVERAKAMCPQFDFVLPATDWCDIVPQGLNKGTALSMLLDEMGIAQDEVVVFGDAGNDLAILSTVENSVAVANATDEVKAAARWHIGSCDNLAVAQALYDIAEVAGTDEPPCFMR